MAELTKLFELLKHYHKKFPSPDMLCKKLPDGSWKKYSSEEAIQIVDKLSIGLLNYGIKPGDKIAIISENRPEWNFIDLAILQVGAIDVPVYPTITEADYEFIFNHAEIKVCFVSNDKLLSKVTNIKSKVSTLQNIFTIDKVNGVSHWEELLSYSGSHTLEDVEATKDKVQGNDMATIIYTSGTTGVPKGVMLSHNNILSNIIGVQEVLHLESSYKNLSFLPLCHIFERTVLYTYMYAGCSTYYAESIDTLGDNLKELKPHYFSTVPRLLEKIYDKIVAKGNQLEGSKKKLFFWALKLGQEWEPTGKSFAYKAQLAIARKLIFSKWKEALGGEVVGILSGSAALQERLARVFNAAGINVRQGYGLTETSPVISFDRFELDDCMIGSVGRPIPGVEVKIIPETGEICCKGPNVMLGYFKLPEVTAQTIDKDGWFHTGDIGVLAEGKYLKITDRIKQLFKTSGGKYVAPNVIESKFVESPLIETMFVTGHDRKFVGALFVPSEEQLKHYCQECGLSNNSMQEMVQHKEVQDHFQKICDEYNVNFSKIEKIKRFKLLPEAWTIETGELTPTMKVKRKVIMEKYAKEIDDIYDV